MKWSTLRLPMLVLLCTAVVVYLVVRPGEDARFAARLMEQYSETPDAETAEELVRLLCDQRLSARQGSRVLELLANPHLIARVPHRSDRPVTIAIGATSWPARSAPGARMEVRRCIQPQDRTRFTRCSSDGIETISRATAPDGSVVDVSAPGTYRITVTLEYALTGTGEPAPGAPLYVCTVDVPVTIMVAEPEQAEQIKLISNPDLDEQMKKTVQLRAVKDGSAHWGTPEASYEIAPAFEIDVTLVSGLNGLPTLPENICFRAVYRDEAGAETVLPDFRVHETMGCRPCSPPSESYPLPLGLMHPDQGVHRGTLLLVPDEEIVYRDPRIKTLYGRTLEFPIGFEVTRTK